MRPDRRVTVSLAQIRERGVRAQYQGGGVVAAEALGVEERRVEIGRGGLAVVEQDLQSIGVNVFRQLGRGANAG